MDGYVGNDGRAAEIHKAGLKAGLGAYRDSTGNAQRAIHPGGAKHAAVFFHRQAEVMAVAKLGILLNLEGRAVAVRRCHHKAGEAFIGWRAEGDQRGAAARDVVSLPCAEIPDVSLRKRYKAGIAKQAGGVRCGVVGRGCGRNVRKEVVIHIVLRDP